MAETTNFCSQGDGEEAIARFSMSAGCVARPDDREQKLCLHHVFRASPLGSMELLEDYSEGQAFSRKYWRS